MTSALEAMMLVCFGLSWPLNLIKNIKAKTAKSMSLKFIILIVLGYIAGIMAKVISGNINYVLAIYVLNLAIVSVNIIVYFVNTKRDKQREIAKMSATQVKEKTEIEKKFSQMNKLANKGSVVFFGTDYFANMPVGELAKHFCIDEDIYNRSVANISIDEMCNIVNSCVIELMPSKVFINIGENETNNNLNEFIEKYEWLMYTISTSTDADIYVVSVLSENANTINTALYNLCKQYGCKYIDITNTIGSNNQTAKAFSVIKPYIRKRPISFYSAMNI